MYKLFMAFRYLRAHKIIYFSIVGVAVGIMTMVVVTSLMGGFSRDMKSRIRGMQTDIVVMSFDKNLWIPDYEGLCKEIESIPDVLGCAPRLEYEAWLGRSGSYSDVHIVGIVPEKEKKVSKLEEYFHKGLKRNFDFKDDGGLDALSRGRPGGRAPAGRRDGRPPDRAPLDDPDSLREGFRGRRPLPVRNGRVRLELHLHGPLGGAGVPPGLRPAAGQRAGRRGEGLRASRPGGAGADPGEVTCAASLQQPGGPRAGALLQRGIPLRPLPGADLGADQTRPAPGGRGREGHAVHPPVAIIVVA